MRKLKSVPYLALVLILFTGAAFTPSVVWADSTGSTGSVTITKHANAAAKAFAMQDYKKARDEYRVAIGLNPENLDFYYGLCDVCVHSNEWDQVVFALEKIFEIDPSKKKQLGAEYGEALFNLRRYDDAIPVLKQALKDADLPLPKISLVVPAPEPEPVTTPPVGTLGATGTTPATTAVTPPPTAVAIVPLVSRQPPAPVNVNEGSLGDYSRNLDNACRSECILLCTYENFENTGDITFYHPPTAIFHIDKFLKGPPLNRKLPVRFEFHDRSQAVAPPGWKFGKDKMPEKGSKWLIFIMNGVPRDGSFDTYQGNYGRQPASEENLNYVYAKLESAQNR